MKVYLLFLALLIIVSSEAARRGIKGVHRPQEGGDATFRFAMSTAGARKQHHARIGTFMKSNKGHSTQQETFKGVRPPHEGDATHRFVMSTAGARKTDKAHRHQQEVLKKML